MRVSLAKSKFVVAPGESFTLSVEVANTAEVIDAVSASVAGLMGAKTASMPAELRLFPGTVGTLKLPVELPKVFPAGRHHARVEVRSLAGAAGRGACDFVVDVPALPRASVSLSPLTRRGRRKGSFRVLCHNGGNVPLEVLLSASDPERALGLSCVPEKLVVRAGSSARAMLYVQAPRKLFGTERARPVSLTARVLARPDHNARGSAPVPRAFVPSPSPAGLVPGGLGPIEAQATYVQRPTVPSGVGTAAVLATIVVLWASIFIVGLRAVLAEQPVTKSAPLSFFAPIGAATTTGSTSSPSVLAGLPGKDLAPLGVAASISGKVTSPGQGGGVGGVMVQAWELGSGGGPPASTATLSDGTYEVTGLFPGRYKISFSAPGFKTTWFPSAPSEAAASSIEVAAGSTASRVDVVVRGQPATIRGQVVTGETPSPAVRVSAAAEALSGPSGQPVAGWPVRRTTQAARNGTYLFSGLPSPATYVVTFSAPGFLPVQEHVHVTGGEAAVANVVPLRGRPGEISGTVSSGGGAVGGVRVSASANGSTFVSETPTAGVVGHFSLAGLATPASYLLSFYKPGYGPVTIVVDLGPGQVVRNLRVSMTGGAGSIEGRVVGPRGEPLGGVTVTVSGLARPISTETLTAGQVGTYKLSGLPTPGTYAVSFSRSGYTAETIGISLATNGLAKDLDVSLPLATGQLSGKVKDASTSRGLAGVAVLITDGSHRYRTYTASSPAGYYQVPQLPAGTYTVTYLLRGYATETALVGVRAGDEVTQSVSLRRLPR